VQALPRCLMAPVVAMAAAFAAGAQDVQSAPQGRWLRLNIPAYRLDVLDDSTIVKTYRVAVGMRRFPTPTGAYALHEVVWNPWWTPPKSAWARLDTVTPPGPANPLGKVKMRVDGAILLHGTPFPSSIGHAASHACIRLSNRDAIAIAREILARDASDLPVPAMDSILAGWDVGRTVSVKTPVRFEIVYQLAEVRDSTLWLYPDIYRRGGEGHAVEAMRVLALASLDTLRVDRSALDRAAARARTRSVSIPFKGLARHEP
jgi:murein L,D-transpeptidase YcbB/YkuD